MTRQADRDIGAYLDDMGVGSLVMNEILATPNKEIHQLNWQDLSSSSLVTIGIDRMSAMIGGNGVNGLAGEPTKQESGRKALFAAKKSWPFVSPINRKTITLQADFAYRRGGGVVELALSMRDSVAGGDVDVPVRGFEIKLTPGDADYRLVKSVNDEPLRQVIPLAQFCKLSSKGRMAIGLIDDPVAAVAPSSAAANPRQPPIATDIEAIEGMNGLFNEACAPLYLGEATEAKEETDQKEPSPRERPRRDLVITF
jgi:hypothetical protein